MKRCLLIIVIWGISWFACPPSVQAQSTEAMQLMLNIEKLSLINQTLSQLYSGYKTLSDGYNKVKNLASGNFKLHEVFLDGLYLVSPEVRKYRRVADIIEYQLSIVKEYKSAFKHFKELGVFNTSQIEYFGGVYKQLLDDSMQNLDELMMVLTAGQLRMSDDERLSSIDRIYEDTKKKLLFLRSFNREHTLIGAQMMDEKTELEGLERLHGLK